MPLYYLKDEGRTLTPHLGTSAWISLLLGVILIILSGATQPIGLQQGVVRVLEGLLPHGFVPKKPPTLLLTMDNEGKDFDAMDIAMALRGLGKLRADKVLINGAFISGTNPLPMLTDLVESLGKDGIRIVAPHSPSLDGEFMSVSLRIYDPPSCLGLVRQWPVFPSKVSTHVGYASGCFLPDGKSGGIPLFATDNLGQIIGSLWWGSLADNRQSDFPWLLFGRLLLLPNHSTVWINQNAEFEPVCFTAPGKCAEVQLDSFLLHLEQKERGTISPGFDGMWEHSTVVIGRPSDVSKVRMLDALLDQTFLQNAPVTIQAGITLVWILLFLLLAKLRLLSRLLAAVILLIVWISVCLVLLHHAIILPLMTGVLAMLILLLPFERPSTK